MTPPTPTIEETLRKLLDTCECMAQEPDELKHATAYSEATFDETVKRLAILITKAEQNLAETHRQECAKYDMCSVLESVRADKAKLYNEGMVALKATTQKPDHE